MQLKGFLPGSQFDSLLNLLHERDYRCIGPRVTDGTILYREIRQHGQLPVGIHSEQQPGRYRLHTSDSPRCFSWANGPQAIKPLTFSPHEVLWHSDRDENGLHFKAMEAESEKLALIGVRACDLAALAMQRRHFGSDHGDPYFIARQSQLLIIAVHCTTPADTCFCNATGDGPEVKSGCDIALNELDDGFLLHTDSALGESIASGLPLQPASQAQQQQARDELNHAARSQQRRLPDTGKQKALYNKLDHPAWQAVAERCLACGNCTSVCPSCFCHHEYEEPSIEGEHSAHVREWDSCFSAGHSQVHGIVLRNTTQLRYRQWLTHKFAGWHEQFGRSGCVGCGRCITWCPAGIDVTEILNELSAE